MKARVKSTGVLVDVTPQLNINSQHSRDYLAVYNIGEYAKGYKHGFDDGVKECIEAIKGNGKK